VTALVSRWQLGRGDRFVTFFYSVVGLLEFVNQRRYCLVLGLFWDAMFHHLTTPAVNPMTAGEQPGGISEALNRRDGSALRMARPFRNSDTNNPYCQQYLTPLLNVSRVLNCNLILIHIPWMLHLSTTGAFAFHFLEGRINMRQVMSLEFPCSCSAYQAGNRVSPTACSRNTK
jgi:hypothetical protein